MVSFSILPLGTPIKLIDPTHTGFTFAAVKEGNINIRSDFDICTIRGEKTHYTVSFLCVLIVPPEAA